MIRKTLLCTAAAIAIASPVSAADLATKAPLQAQPFIASPWDGLYIGGNIGFGSTDFSISGGGFNDSVTGSGVLGGVQLGYNKQFGTVVLGLETDFDATSISHSEFGAETKLSWFGTTRARFGFLVSPVLLFYGTAGVAYGHAEISGPGITVTVPGVGWAAGAGLQYALTPQWSIGAEYLHVDLSGPSISGGGIAVDTKATTDLGRATLNYKF